MRVRGIVALLWGLSVWNVCGTEEARKEDEELGPCQACKTLVGSFEEGMKKTDRKHFGGGDTAWEEKNLGDYERSETRLIEVQELLCGEVERGKKQCQHLAELWEPYLEEWWFGDRAQTLSVFLCEGKAQVCCPPATYGAECKPCPGHPGPACGGNGRCRGDGTRRGSGECVCDEGYSGPACGACSSTHYPAYRDTDKVLCSKCHESCEGGCRGAGPGFCNNCRTGWTNTESGGCVDVDECLTQRPCKKNEFCINKEGSHACLLCDPSCATCYGDGPDMCRRCAEGYTKQDGLCTADRSWNQRAADTTRYLTYAGLTIATCIIFQKNTLVASLIGLAVAAYVSISEYMLHSVLNTNQPLVQ